MWWHFWRGCAFHPNSRSRSVCGALEHHQLQRLRRGLERSSNRRSRASATLIGAGVLRRPFVGQDRQSRWYKARCGSHRPRPCIQLLFAISGVAFAPSSLLLCECRGLDARFWRPPPGDPEMVRRPSVFVVTTGSGWDGAWVESASDVRCPSRLGSSRVASAAHPRLCDAVLRSVLLSGVFFPVSALAASGVYFAVSLADSSGDRRRAARSTRVAGLHRFLLAMLSALYSFG